MTNNNSLLAHLAWKLTNQTETLATQALGYILSQSPAARQALQETIRTGGADVGPIASVATEARGKKNERVDLAALDEQGSERVLIEAKFWAGLTDNQPNTYLERLLPDGNPAALLFVAPEARLETLWPEVLRVAIERFSLGEDGGTEDVKSAIVAKSKCRLMLTSWRVLLRNMRLQASTDGDFSAVRDILQLVGLCEQEDSNAFLPLRSEQLGLEFARLMPHLVQLVQEAASSGKRKGFIAQDRLRFASTGSGHGYWLNFAGTHAWFGIDYEVWAYLRETPLWLVVWDKSGYMKFTTVRSRLQPLIDEGQAIDNVTYIQIPIHLPLGVEYQSVLSAVVDSLQGVAKLISPPNGRPQGRPRTKA